jgi:hypothetical protein
MSIDGIGKRGGIPGAPAPGAASPGEFKLGESKGLGAAEQVSSAEAVAPGAASDALTALERGDISVDQYLDARVQSAVAPLEASLSPDQLQFVRGELRAALENDPVLVELVRKATGVVTSGA